MRAFVAANALWELSFMGLKTFIVLYVVKGLGESVGTASAVMGVVAGAYVIAAFGAGRLADAIGVHRLMRVSIWVYGVGLLVGAGLSLVRPFLIGLPLIALAGAVVMTLPYGILVGVTPAGAEGALTGLFSFSRALGAVLGPIVVGVAIDVLAAGLPGHERLRRHVDRHRRPDPPLAAVLQRPQGRGRAGGRGRGAGRRSDGRPRAGRLVRSWLNNGPLAVASFAANRSGSAAESCR